MTHRFPQVAKALIVLTAAGLLLGGCHVGHRAYHGGPHYAQPHYGKHYHHEKRKHHGHHRRGGGRGGWR
jgi:hypothetical protein